MSKVLSNMNSAEENNKYLRSVLPTHGKGTYKGKIDWKNSVGCTIEYEYEWYGKIYTGSLTISRYENKYIYFEGIEKGIRTGRLQKCLLGAVIGIRTADFKLKVGQHIQDKRDLIIIDSEYRTIKGKKWKFYKYRCTCTNEDWILEGDLTKGHGCNACCGQKAVLGINTIWDKARWMVDLGVSEEDAKKYTPQSSQKIEVTCPYCGRKKKCTICYIYRTHSIGCNACGDGVSYPEKFMYSVLEQLNIKFETQYCPKWLNSKQRYDFYLSDYNIILEIHGEQHYEESGRGRSLEKEQENDIVKKELALNNGIENYIVIDCRKSEMNWIKEQILNSDLVKLFDLSTVNWDKCNEFALKNLVKEVCDYWHEHREINGEDITTVKVSEVFGLDRNTIRRYLKQGNELNWCNYNAKDEKSRSGKANGGQNKQPIYCPELSEIFISARDAERKLKDLGIKVNRSHISSVCNSKRKTHGQLQDGTRLHWQFI